MSATVYEITYSGEGERGRSVEVMGEHTIVERYAREAADYFDSLDMRAEGYWPYDFAYLDGTSRVVEVVMEGDPSPPIRMRVKCRVERTYEVEEFDPARDLLLAELAKLPKGSCFVRCDVYGSLGEEHRNIKKLGPYQPYNVPVCTLEHGLVRDSDGRVFAPGEPQNSDVVQGWAACRLMYRRGDLCKIAFETIGGIVKAEVLANAMVIGDDRS